MPQPRGQSPSKLSSRGQVSLRPSAPSGTKKKGPSTKKKKSARKRPAEGPAVADGEILDDVAEGEAEEEGEEGADESASVVPSAGRHAIGSPTPAMSSLSVAGPPSAEPLVQNAGAATQQIREAEEAEEEARAARDRGRLDEAERLYRRVLQLRREALGDRHALTISTIEYVAGI